MRRISASVLAAVTVVASCSSVGGPGDGPGGAAPGSAVEQVLLAGRGLPDDPRLAARQLVRAIMDADSDADAAGAVGELLRRSGFPIVTADGQVVGLPDDGGFPDYPIYAELLADFARAVRSSSGYPYPDVAAQLVDLGVFPGSVDWPVMATVLSSWGKQADEAAVAASASSAVRALSAAHGWPIDASRDGADVFLDPLQATILIAHLGEVPLLRSDGGGGSGGPGSSRRPAQSASGACTELNRAFNGGSMVEKGLVKGVSWFISEANGAALDALPEQYQGSVRNFRLAKGTSALKSYLPAFMLMIGVRFVAEPVAEMHYMHADGEAGARRTLRVTAEYDSGMGDQTVECYRLAGIKVPQKGPMTGFGVDWEIAAQSTGPVRDAAGNFTSPGRHVQVVSNPRQAFPRGTTDASGAATLTVKPPVEGEPVGEGDVIRDDVVIRAKLRKDAKLTDFIAFNVPGALTKVAVNLSIDAYLPSVLIVLPVAYHGSDPIIVKGATDDVPLFFLMATIKSTSIDLYSCKGLSGPWKGEATWGGLEFNALGKSANATLDKMFGSQGFEQIAARSWRHEVAPFAATPGTTTVFDAFGGEVVAHGELELKADLANYGRFLRQMKDGRLGHEVGEARIVVGGGSSQVAPLPVGTITAFRVESDPRCDGSAPHWDRS